MEYTDIQFEIQDKGEIARIRLNRPDSMNALTQNMRQEFEDAVQAINDDNIVRVLIVSGNGRAFCTGGNMKITAVEGAHPPGLIDMMEDHMLGAWHDLLEPCRVPTIAQVHGYVMAAGYTLMNQCDLIIAAEGTKIGIQAVRFDGPELGKLLWMVPLRKFNELSFTGRLLDAREWYEMGTINKVVPMEKLEEETTALAREIANMNPLTLRLQRETTKLTLDIMGMNVAQKAGQFIHVIGDFANGAWSEEILSKRLQLGMHWFNHAVKAGVFRDTETTNRVIKKSFEELQRQGGAFTDLDSMDQVIKEAVEAVRNSREWKDPKLR